MPQRVPFGLIRQLVKAGGRRLQPVESLLRDSTLEAKWTHAHSVRNGSSLALVNPPTNGPVPLGPGWARRSLGTAPPTPLQSQSLPNDAYRFWIGRSGVANFAKCRGCDQVFLQTDKRTLSAHLASGACKVTVLTALQLLNRDKRCALCDVRTGATKWGVPLCSDNCQRAWMFFQPKAYVQARALSFNNNLGVSNEEIFDQFLRSNS